MKSDATSKFRLARRASVVAIAIVAALSAAGSLGLAAGNKPVTQPRIVVTFADRATDVLTSDCAGSETPCPYWPADGFNNQIWTGGSQDATMRLNYDGRRFHMSCDATALSDSPPLCGSVNPPSPFTNGPSHDGWFLNIRQIGDMKVGCSKATDALFSFDGDMKGPLPEASLVNKRFRWTGLDSMKVLVTRTSVYHWDVSTAPSSSPSAVSDQAYVDKYVGGKTNSYVLVGQYRVPFALAIDIAPGDESLIKDPGICPSSPQ